MCGFAGYLAFRRIEPEVLAWREYSLQALRRRGPDDIGEWSDECCWLGFRRLSILDLSEGGHQPMHSHDGRSVIVYNGELYNYRELAAKLTSKGTQFRSRSDTEVVLEYLNRFGASALNEFNGMFGLGLYRRDAKRILLAGDHAGIKPLYYLHTEDGVAFCSQYNILIKHPWARSLSVSQAAFALCVRMGYVPAPYGLLEKTHALGAGCFIEIGAEGISQEGAYYEFPRHPHTGPPATVDELDAAIRNSVRRQLVSDVPVGIFLSGGIDSPLVAAQTTKVTTAELPAFTIGTEDAFFNESVPAAQYARELGLRHHLRTISGGEVLGLLDDVLDAQSEILCDNSLFPTLLLCATAREKVTVALSGDGGDELFWGYFGRFASVIRMAHEFEQPRSVRQARWYLKRFLSIGSATYNLRYANIGELYRQKHSRFSDDHLGELLDADLQWPSEYQLFDFDGVEPGETAAWLRWNEFVSHLKMILLKVDRASMYHSLEVRVPLLDREVLEVASRAVWHECLDLDAEVGKLPLRNVLSRYCSFQTTEKKGFSVPMDEWLRGPLREVLYDRLVNRSDLLGMPLNRKAVMDIVTKHERGPISRVPQLWQLLNISLWLDHHL